MNFTKPWHIIAILVVFIVLFGAKRLPDSARAIGRSLRIFKSEVRELNEEDKNDKDDSKSGKSEV